MSRKFDYYKGPTVLRGEQIPTETTDARLLASEPQAEWVHTDPWRVLRIQAEFVEGFGALAELGPAISLFGSARTAPGTPEYALAEETARLLMQKRNSSRNLSKFGGG